MALQPFLLLVEPNTDKMGLSCFIRQQSSAIVHPIAHMSIFVSYFLVRRMTSGALYHLEVTWRDSFLLNGDFFFDFTEPPSSATKLTLDSS